MAQSVSDYYDGSRLLSGLSEYLGISVDKVNFVVSQFVALLLASLFRTVLHPSKVSAATRHGFGLIFALVIGYFCFGIQAIHLAALPAACYLVIRTQSPEVMQRMVLAVSLFYLSLIHLHRQIYDYGSYNLDITGPLMVITQKVTSLAFSLHDGLTKSEDEMSKSQKLYAVRKLPTALEYFSFTLHFPSLMAGPVIFYKDYMDFIDGSNLKSPVASDRMSESDTIVIEPSPMWAVCKKIVVAVMCAVMFVKFLPMFPISRVKDDDFVENTSVTQKIVYLFVSTTLVRFKYYFAWTLADAICNNAGIGYNGIDENGSAKWDKFSNVDILKYESYNECMAVGDLKSLLVNVCNITASNMILYFEETELKDDVILKELGAEPFGVLELRLVSRNPEDKISIDDAFREYTVVPDVITVRVQTSEEGIKDVVVEVENRAILKPFLGGYFDKHTGLEYHHGYSQTGPPKPKVPPELRNHRDTQTYFMRNRKLDMEYSQATQMTSDDIWIPNVTDKIITAGPYETAEEREKRLDIEGKVRTIQRYFRAWLTSRRLKELSAEYHKRLQLMLEREALEKKEDMERKKRDLISRVFPRTAADFSMLYAMTERWKKAEIKRIISMHCGPAKIAEFYMLLEKEIEILRSIEALRMKLKDDRKLQKEIDFFKTIGDPWTFLSSYKKIPVVMDTLETQKGRTYRELYETVSDRNLNPSERMLVLLELKRGLESHNCVISNELIDLIDRACELLARGFGGKDIETLQMRIDGLLLHHFELTECNEGVTNRYNRLAEKSMKENMFYCQCCHKLKPIESCAVGIKTNVAKICTTCKFIDRSEPWIDISPYRFILRQIRRTERLLYAHSSIAFILQDKDIYYIVVHIWHAHSALSECDNIYLLRLVRWDRTRDWSPWNCILLTAEEAKAHLKIERLEDFATNLRESIEAWNLGTNRWLRMVVYERVHGYPMVLTYALSALWHGFYPGYYITFANGALFTIASRTMRRTVRNYFLANAETKFFYDAITFVATRILMTYMVF
ncbi:IQ and ubiquitin-like domain-containing protein, partial [Asbolus verrucosus]